MRPITIPAHIQAYNQTNEVLEKEIANIKDNFARLLQGPPEVSVVMPAYNEEASILKTLYCLSKSVTRRSVEIIVVNNNSKDNTEAIVLKTGARCINETKQGITPARNAGLAAALGKYVLNADADTIYPPDWIEQMVQPLEKDDITAVYGRFSFLPTANTPRTVYFFYEYMADWMRLFNKAFREEAVNVYGFNSGFKRAQGLAVNGFDHPPEANEDGWLALKLRDKGFGKLHYVTDTRALVWTTDRRIQQDGGLWKGLVKRVKRIVTNNSKYGGQSAG
ncbi:MAG TPA: glycosyltransferase family 2 protein [Chitinophagaceae bacterium]|nr:glycosyltransferase family 2 protein [Chitinophagaceae bacterium]